MKTQGRRRVSTPRVIQMEAVECGVAALAIILGYYGRYLPLEVLRVDCGVSRDGSNALNLFRAAEKYGLVGKGFRRPTEELYNIEFPAILFWEFKHFVVLEGFGKNKVYLNDPATGPRYVTLDEFDESYSGIVLEFEIGEKFEKGGNPPPLHKQIYARLKTVPSPLVFTFLTGLGLLLPGFALPALLMFFIDTFYQIDLLPWKWTFLLAVLLSAIFSVVLTWLRQYSLTRLNSNLSIRFSSDFLWRLLQLPMEFYSQRYTGEIAYRLSLNESVVQALTGSLIFSAVDLLLIVFYALVMFTYDPTIALIGIAAGVLNLLMLTWIYRSRANAYACLQQDLGKSNGESISGLANIETIKSRGGETDFFARWAGYYTRTINAWQEIGKKDVFLNTLPILFQLLASAALLGIGSVRIIEGTLSIGILMAMQLLQNNFLQPINRFVGFGQVMQNMQIDLERINDVMNNPVDPTYAEKRQIKSERVKLEGELEFRNVTFGYDPLAPPLIENLSFAVKPGSRLALVGPTGSGKSTIAKLASGLFHPWSGEILYDGISIKELPRELLYNSIATVDQDIFLFGGTIRENLTLWNYKVPDEMLFSACRDAAILEEILLREEGLDSHLIEGGKNLSGGQRQRIEIARSLLFNPSLLILDEATSALDSKVEHTISDSIKQRGCSALMIAHRLSTIQDCDEIIVLDKGKVSQRGNHQELKAIPGIYQELILSEVPD